MASCDFEANCNHKDCEKDLCLRKYKLDSLYNTSLLSKSQRRRVALVVTKDNIHDKEEYMKLKSFCDNVVENVKNGKNLYIHSDKCGNGKTSWAVRIMQEYFNKIWPGAGTECRALFISVPKLLLAIKDNISEHSDYVAYVKENILNADLVVWDDIAAKVGSAFEINYLFNFIDGRLSEGKANIYTSNLNEEGLKNALDLRLASRIASYSEEIVFTDDDKRSLTQNNEAIK